MQKYESNGLTLVSLFAGGGGSSLGYKMAGYNICLAVEWDAEAAICYRLNFPETQFYEGDIYSLENAEVLRLSKLKEGELDVLDGSPPCQGFSTAGERKFDDTRNELYKEFIRMLITFKPKVFIMENVSGLIKGKMKIKFAEITLALKKAGYKVSCRLLNAWWYGIAQDRKRLVWIGIREDLGIAPSHPEPTVKRPIMVREALNPNLLGIRNDILGNRYRKMNLPSPSLLSSSPPRVLIESHPGYNNKFKEGLAPTIRAGRKPKLAREKPISLKGISNIYKDIPSDKDIGRWQARKIDLDKLSYTQIMSQPNWHPLEARPITIKEAKILHGFPDWFKITEYRIIGNSVPPPMAEAIGKHLAILLHKEQLSHA